MDDSRKLASDESGRKQVKPRPALRERKKMERRNDILRVAAAVFRRKGFEATRIEEIAAEADVAPGTVYNYYATKDALLLALASQHRARTPTLVEPLISKPPATALLSFTKLYGIMARESMRYLNKAMWRHVHAAMIVNSWPASGDDRWQHEETLLDYECKLLAALQNTGALPEYAQIKPLAELIHAAGFYWWERFIAEDRMSIRQYSRHFERNMRFILGGYTADDSHESPGGISL